MILLIFRNIYFKEHFPQTASLSIIVQDWYIFHIIFHGLHIFSFLLPWNKYTCFQKHVRYLPLKTSRSGKSRTVGPHLTGKKPGIIFLYFLPNVWAIGFPFCTERLGKYQNFPRKSNFVLIRKMAPKVLRFVLSAFYPTLLYCYSKSTYNVKSLAYHFNVKTKILADFHICIFVDFNCSLKCLHACIIHYVVFTM